MSKIMKYLVRNTCQKKYLYWNSWQLPLTYYIFKWFYRTVHLLISSSIQICILLYAIKIVYYLRLYMFIKLNVIIKRIHQWLSGLTKPVYLKLNSFLILTYNPVAVIGLWIFFYQEDWRPLSLFQHPTKDDLIPKEHSD